MKKQNSILKQLLDINQRNADAKSATVEPTTPIRQSRQETSGSTSQYHQSQVVSGAAIHLSTPQKSIPKPSKLDDTEYIRLSKHYSNLSYDSTLPDVCFTMINTPVLVRRG
ncbi:hypothetical protein COEREDRAFT_14552 [Coemansia reversa NRRL 1564]|uniref:Uncharacterized protein n=1 Tax=Coemansia reversa (strain ATCC 12441 / NRRL 1564) TaxID=763665 RepID=A0A2G5BEH6_COERN|nr:hypothetical protein COEREDRAFT_14552 [Coemansia reversa NRRL 1564]|eukprot:PIA17403.1 hypothetical protein COEREDRAFT_14552 [Coemansia reversa NRRL 1564]